MYKSTENDYYTPFFLKSSLFKIIFVALVYNILAFLSFRITVSPENISPIFPAAGFALAATIIAGYRSLIGIWVGSFIANMFTFMDTAKMLDKSFFETTLASGSVATGVVIGVAIGTYLINLFNKREYPMRNGYGVIIFIAVSFIYCAICSLIAVASISFWGLSTPNHFF